jgi:tRNA dimethylallyltransferase
LRFDRLCLRASAFLVGPTAVGKSDLALMVARRLARGGQSVEIVALDSMTVYRRLDIGTAKPTAADRAEVPHHLLDLLDPHEEFTVAMYVAAAERAVQDILNRKALPLFVGGSGLYLRTLLRGLFEGPEADWSLRHQLEAQARDDGPERFHARLGEVDAATAARLHPNDLRRIIRAREVFELTGRPLSEWQQERPVESADRPRLLVWLDPDREGLYERIDRRVDVMLDAGLIAETRAVQETTGFGRTAGQSLGYREVLEHLAAGTPLESCRVAIQTHTRQFAKRQCTWFRNLEELEAIPVNATTNWNDLADQLVTRLTT